MIRTRSTVRELLVVPLRRRRFEGMKDTHLVVELHSFASWIVGVKYRAPVTSAGSMAGWFRGHERRAEVHYQWADLTLQVFAIQVTVRVLVANATGPICSGCKNEIDPDVCHCGSVREVHGYGRSEEHEFVPLGCDCLRERNLDEAEL